MFHIINSFSEIEIRDVKTLIICDIDYTLLKYNMTLDECYSIIKKDFFDASEKEITKMTYEYLYMYKYINHKDIVHTDLEGFNGLLQKMTPSSKIVYLTARKSNSEKFTMEQLEFVGINVSKNDIYYTDYSDNEMLKGDYIIGNMDLSGYEDIIFIDDNESQLNSVKSLFPHIRCFKFVI
jgi:hypothetical protein